MRAPPFQDTWNVTLGGRAQDLRRPKICARGGVHDRSFQTDHSRQTCLESWLFCTDRFSTGQKKASAEPRLFDARFELLFVFGKR